MSATGVSQGAGPGADTSAAPQGDATSSDILLSMQPELLGKALLQPLPVRCASESRADHSSALTEARKDHAGAFAVCRTFARAVLTAAKRASIRLGVLRLGEGGGSLAGVLACLRLTHEAHLKDLVLYDSMYGLPDLVRMVTGIKTPFKLTALVTAMQEHSVVLPYVTTVTLKGLYLPPSLSVLHDLFPSLTHLTLCSCHTPPSHPAILTTLPPLTYLALSQEPAADKAPDRRASAADQAQLSARADMLAAAAPYLASLPALMLGRGFAGLLHTVAGALGRGARLMRLELYPGPEDPYMQYVPYMGPAKSLTQLTTLTELSMSTFHLPRWDNVAIVPAIASLLHLTSLTWDMLGECRGYEKHGKVESVPWKTLRVGRVCPDVLATLPLQHVMRFELRGLVLDKRVTVEHIQQAVANLQGGDAGGGHGAGEGAGGSSTGGVGASVGGSSVHLWHASTDARLQMPYVFILPWSQTPDRQAELVPKPPPLIAACSPLIPPEAAGDLHIHEGILDAATVEALAAAVPAPLRRLTVRSIALVLPCFWPALAKACPKLETFTLISESMVLTASAGAYFTAAVEAGNTPADMECQVITGDRRFDNEASYITDLRTTAEQCTTELGVPCRMRVREYDEVQCARMGRVMARMEGQWQDHYFYHCENDRGPFDRVEYNEDGNVLGDDGNPVSEPEEESEGDGEEMSDDGEMSDGLSDGDGEMSEGESEEASEGGEDDASGSE